MSTIAAFCAGEARHTMTPLQATATDARSISHLPSPRMRASVMPSITSSSPCAWQRPRDTCRCCLLRRSTRATGSFTFYQQRCLNLLSCQMVGFPDCDLQPHLRTVEAVRRSEPIEQSWQHCEAVYLSLNWGKPKLCSRMLPYLKAFSGEITRDWLPEPP